ncbi:hypothetical protein PHYBLDRAFT_74017 [Phycomyces blakesleeanus NRRL 1555(-)]|uniref:Uncharacterized protein n=1 Tax=Phycomyces blakesleeanus (strain ATCC 8743b / DSM 1359 / FGSC 10004 / NBRC 33097 / NRRL 1555) TaxID=763407 RepID=A0A162T2K7_PHYB8|nr:hypothetical protein PHYBLDRAFT_74017 [Phycomyces blakesleeanus NRRL 1555(-)]OAD65762.1 hypothetical protein PHYBLDRAFT_74017 [Phycomyces blakesleeanus NRRL 1555(-)]|eukprot:XP_018283802.1 hypothetical protein PHYBLDRAFT_74017 [Phycomyces blakesleeanus NRRL 1555(-)]
MRHKVVFQDDGGHLLLEYYFLQPAFCQECIYCLTSVGVTVMTSSHKLALGLPTKLAPYRSDTVYPAPLLLISIESHHLLIEHDVMSNIMHEDNVSLFKDYWYCLDNSEEYVYINFMSSLLRLHSRY